MDAFFGQPQTAAADDDTACVICGLKHSPPLNPIMFCDGGNCDVPVHKDCYGVADVPAGDWFCQRCEDKTPVHATRAVCCSSMTAGAFKRTKDYKKYIHAVCALWHPSIKHQKEPIDIPEVILGTKVCCICNKASGITTSCTHKKCVRFFHITCALEVGALQKAPEHEVSTEKLLCPKHADRARRRTEKFRDVENQQGEQPKLFRHDQRSLDSMDTELEQAHYFSNRVEQLAKKAKTRHQEENKQYASSTASSSKPVSAGYSSSEYLNTLPIKRPAVLEHYLSRDSPLEQARTYMPQPSVPVMQEMHHPVVSNVQMEVNIANIQAQMGTMLSAMQELLHLRATFETLRSSIQDSSSSLKENTDPKQTSELQKTIIALQSQLLKQREESKKILEEKQSLEAKLNKMGLNVYKVFSQLKTPDAPTLNDPEHSEEFLKNLVEILEKADKN